MKSRQFCTSEQGDQFKGSHQSKQDAIKAYRAAGSDEPFYIGEAVKVYPNEFFSAEDILDSIEDVARNEIGEAAEGWLSQAPQEHLEDLETVMLAWFVKHGYMPTFRRVQAIELVGE